MAFGERDTEGVRFGERDSDVDLDSKGVGLGKGLSDGVALAL